MRVPPRCFGFVAALALVILPPPVYGAETMISIRLVKTASGRCNGAPTCVFNAPSDAWRVTAKPHHNGENDWEIFWEIETDRDPLPLAEMTVTAPGVRVQRVLIGKTDVPFHQEGDRISFRLIDDRSRGRLMQVTYQDPRGGYPIDFIHNWKMRRFWQYEAEPYPARQVTAIKNYLLAAHEMLRRMGDMGPGQSKPFRGDIVLMDSEIAATRAHIDYPPHVHIMFYQFEKNAAGEIEWVGRLVPHFYMDEQARIVRNSYAVLAGPGKSAELGVGEVCRFENTFGHRVLDLIIADYGLILRRPDGGEYSLRPDPQSGADHAVYGYHKDQPICRAAAHDDPEHSVFRFEVDTLTDGKVTNTFRDGYRYDPFTAKVLGKFIPDEMAELSAAQR